MEISIILIIMFILGLEAVNIAARLIFGSSKRFWKLRKMPRVHHMFFGALLLIFYNYWYLFEIGIALIVQDLIHHFVVLPLWVGEAEFL